MDTSRHNLEDLFLQLGIPNSPKAIEAFIHNNRLPNKMLLEEAACWSAGQAQFIHEALAEDSDWCEAVDQLDARLRH